MKLQRIENYSSSFLVIEGKGNEKELLAIIIIIGMLEDSGAERSWRTLKRGRAFTRVTR